MKKVKSVAPEKKKISPFYIAAAAIVGILLISAAVWFFVLTPPPVQDEGAKFQKAGALYTKSVDLANDGQYQQALDTADQALALNVTSLTPLIQANRAGILVMLGDNMEAIAASDASIAAAGNLTNTTSVAYFNKGNALKNLGRYDEARLAYNNATALDPTLVSPL